MPTVTLSLLETRVWDRLDSNQEMWPRAEVDNAINEALRVNQCFTGFNMGKVTLPNYTDAYRVIYEVPGSVAIPLAIYFNGRALRFRSLASMATSQRNWLNQDSSYAGQVSNWTPIGVHLFAINPADANGGASVEIYGVMDMTPLAKAADVATLQDEFIALLSDYAAHVLLVKMPGRMFQQGLALYKAWQMRVRDLGRWRMDTWPDWPRQQRGIAL